MSNSDNQKRRERNFLSNFLDDQSAVDEGERDPFSQIVKHFPNGIFKYDEKTQTETYKDALIDFAFLYHAHNLICYCAIGALFLLCLVLIGFSCYTIFDNDFDESYVVEGLLIFFMMIPVFVCAILQLCIVRILMFRMIHLRFDDENEWFLITYRLRSFFDCFKIRYYSKRIWYSEVSNFYLKNSSWSQKGDRFSVCVILHNGKEYLISETKRRNRQKVFVKTLREKISSRTGNIFQKEIFTPLPSILTQNSSKNSNGFIFSLTNHDDPLSQMSEYETISMNDDDERRQQQQEKDDDDDDNDEFIEEEHLTLRDDSVSDNEEDIHQSKSQKRKRRKQKEKEQQQQQQEEEEEEEEEIVLFDNSSSFYQQQSPIKKKKGSLHSHTRTHSLEDNFFSTINSDVKINRIRSLVRIDDYEDLDDNDNNNIRIVHHQANNESKEGLLKMKKKGKSFHFGHKNRKKNKNRNSNNNNNNKNNNNNNKRKGRMSPIVTLEKEKGRRRGSLSRPPFQYSSNPFTKTKKKTSF